LRYLTRDVTKNHPLAEAYGIIALWLGADFLNGDLFTTQADYTLRHNKKRKAAFFTRAPTHAQTPARTHDRVKARLVAPDAPYLQMMGIAGKDGAILASGQKKYRQINKYLEIIDALLDRESLPEAPLIVDMGSGKGYLTFALYDYLRHQKELKPRITGIELRPALVDFCNELTRRLGYEDLHFVAQDIEDFQSERIDMLMIAAVRDAVDPEAQEKVEALKRQFGIEYHQLERLLRESRLTSE
jgi:SAM-dependent methyltransferase